MKEMAAPGEWVSVYRRDQWSRLAEATAMPPRRTGDMLLVLVFVGGLGFFWSSFAKADTIHPVYFVMLGGWLTYCLWLLCALLVQRFPDQSPFEVIEGPLQHVTPGQDGSHFLVAGQTWKVPPPAAALLEQGDLVRLLCTRLNRELLALQQMAKPPRQALVGAGTGRLSAGSTFHPSLAAATAGGRWVCLYHRSIGEWLAAAAWVLIKVPFYLLLATWAVWAIGLIPQFASGSNDWGLPAIAGAFGLCGLYVEVCQVSGWLRSRQTTIGTIDKLDMTKRENWLHCGDQRFDIPTRLYQKLSVGQRVRITHAALSDDVFTLEIDWPDD